MGCWQVEQRPSQHPECGTVAQFGSTQLRQERIMSKTGKYFRGALTIIAGTVAALIASTGIAPARPFAHIASAHIHSVRTSGTSARPEVTVIGSRFGSRPAPKPSYSPAGKFGCPKVPAAGAGHLYGDLLYFTDLKAKRGTYKNWTAGQYNNMFQDCIGIVIDQWSNTKVRFHFGDLYAKLFPGNTYLLSNGDRFEVFVRHATLKATATLSH